MSDDFKPVTFVLCYKKKTVETSKACCFYTSRAPNPRLQKPVNGGDIPWKLAFLCGLDGSLFKPREIRKRRKDDALLFMRTNAAKLRCMC